MSDENPTDTSTPAPDTQEPATPKIEHQRIDLNRYALEHILPQAAQACEEGQLREKMLERDKQPGKQVYWLAEVEPGVWENITPLPHGMPTVRMRGNPLGANGFRWQLVMQLQKQRVCRTHRQAMDIVRDMEIRTVGSVDETKIVRGA